MFSRESRHNIVSPLSLSGVASVDQALVLPRSLRVSPVRAAAGCGLHHLLLPSGQLPGELISQSRATDKILIAKQVSLFTFLLLSGSLWFYLVICQ